MLIGYGYSESKGYNYTNNVLAKRYTNTGFITPTARYYFPVTDKFFFHIDLQVPIQFGRTNIKESNFDGGNQANPNVRTTNNINVGVTILPGMTYMVSKKVGLYANVLPLNVFNMVRTQDLPARTVTTTYSSLANLNLNSLISVAALTIGANIYF